LTTVFISWSGEISREIAEELRNWIPSVLQFAKPYFTPNDIEKGSKWGAEISKKLSEANVGIVCLTKENYQKPWILFEAGALSKDLEHSKVCSILFGMENTDVTGPLTTFQTTEFRQEDFRKMMKSINESGGESKLSDETFDRVFSMWWPELEQKVTQILEMDRDREQEVRTDRELLEEILLLSRSSNKAKSSELDISVPEHILEEILSSLSQLIRIQKESNDMKIWREIARLLEVADFLVGRTRKGYRYLDEFKKVQMDFEIPF
jgi:hypothetical protein